MELTGKIHEIGVTQEISDSFKKRDLIVMQDDNPQFVEYIKFEATQDRVNLFDNLNVGDEVEVSFSIKGRPWKNKEGVTVYFNSLVAWRVNKLSEAAADQTPPPVQVTDPEPDDLPF